ncbi:MAG: Clp protease N-terminal domain-containing protein [Gemmatimonadaceae bacterium]
MSVSQPQIGVLFMELPMPPGLTERAHRVFMFAHDLADRRGDSALTSTHLALGLLQEGDGSIPVYLLHTRGVPLDALARELDAQLPAPGVPRSPPSSRKWAHDDDHFVEQASQEARDLDTVYYSSEHLFLALLRDRAGAPARAMARYGVGCAEAQAAVRWIYTAQPGSSPPWQATA